MTDPRSPTRPPFFWLPVAGAFVGLVILGLRIVTLPETPDRTVFVGIAVAIALTLAIFAGLALAIRRRMRAAAVAFPDAVLIPVVVGRATAAATRWFATRFGDERLRLANATSATIAVDATGMHLVRDARGPHARLDADSIRVGPLGRTLLGIREVDALVLEVTTGHAIAPLPIVPLRLRGNPLSSLTDAELLDVVGRVEAALAGRPTTPGWGY